MASVRALAALVSTALVLAPFPAEAAASLARVPEGVVPVSGASAAASVAATVKISVGSPAAPIRTFDAARPVFARAPVNASLGAVALKTTPVVPTASVPALAGVIPAPVVAAFAAPGSEGDGRGPESEKRAAAAAAAFDGRLAAAADARDGSEDAVPAAPLLAPEPGVRRRLTKPRGLFGVRASVPGPLVRAGVFAAKVTGVSALWGVYRDGVLVQRYAQRLSDPDAAPGKRVGAVRALAAFGGVDAVLLLGAVAEDPSPRVRRAARAALLFLADSTAPDLTRTLRRSPFPLSRESAATGLGWLARHAEMPEAVEQLGVSGLMDRSEAARLAAIRALASSINPKAVATLEWMKTVEHRPTMSAAIDRALSEAGERHRAAGRTHLVPPREDLPLAASPLHAAALKSSILVGLTFAAAEFAGGLFTGTLALQADALHLAGDRTLDAAALFAMWIARRPPTSRQTYGWLKAEAVFSLFGALAIAGMGLAMIPEVVQGFLHPAPAQGWVVLGFAALSIVSNLISAAMLHRHQGEHLGVRGAFLHALTDAVGTFGVMIAAAASLLWGWSILMPVATAAMVVMVLRVAWELGRPAWDVLMDAVPPGVDMDKLEADLAGLDGVASVYDLHVRALNSRGAELAAKLYAKPGADAAAILANANAFLRDRYGIVHSTIQIEPAPAAR